MKNTCAFRPDRPNLKRLNVTLAYEGISSAVWAAEKLTGLLRKAWSVPKLCLSPWCFGVLDDPNWGDRVVSESADADMIVLSTSSRIMDQLPPSIEHWLQLCLSRQHGGDRPIVVALFRCGEVPDDIDSPRIQKVMHLVQQAGCGFFAPFLAGPL